MPCAPNLCPFYEIARSPVAERHPAQVTIMAMPQLETAQWVPYPVELVFAFFANPHNLAYMMLPELEARVEDVRLQPPPPRPVAADPARRFNSIAAGKGTEILVSFYPARWFPQRLSWTARIVDFAWNSHFIDEQVRGPFRVFRHRHEFAAEYKEGREGTRTADRIDYALPGGFIGSLAGSRVRKHLEQLFAFRQQRLPEILAVAARQAVQRKGC